MLSVALFQFSQSSYTTSEDSIAINVCLELVDGLLATDVTIELVQGTSDFMAPRKRCNLVLVISTFCSINYSIIITIIIESVQVVTAIGKVNESKEITSIGKDIHTQENASNFMSESLCMLVL